MKTNWLIALAILIFSSRVSGQKVHKDQYEYGYKGKVKEVVKKTYSCSGNECELSDFEEEAALTHHFFYNEAGNIDSTVAKRYIQGERITMTTKYKYRGSQRSGWETLVEAKEQYVHAVTTWISDREYSEKVYDPDNQLQAEVRSSLNDSFRLAKLQSNIFDESGKLVQESVQKFEFDESGKIKNYTTTQGDGSTVFAQCRYLKTDHYGNPLKIVIDKKGERTKSVIILTFTYYD